MQNYKHLFIGSITAFFIFFLFSCKKNEKDPEPVKMGAYQGSFVSSAHPTSGTAIINTSKTTLELQNFMSDSGPDLNIYLAADINNITSDYIDLGDIKGLNGNYSYDVNSSTDFSKYKYVVVWCVDFDVNFGYALLN